MNNSLNKNRNSLIDSIIIFFLLISFLILESLKTLFGLFTYGILRKEILTTKSKYGFDIKIKIK